MTAGLAVQKNTFPEIVASRSSLPVFQIAYDLERREWRLGGHKLPHVVRFAEGKPGAMGLIGAIDTALFAGRETGGILEIAFLDETHRLWFRGNPVPAQSFSQEAPPPPSPAQDFL